MDSVVEQLKKSLECPCCLEPPKPNTKVVGMCANGHMTCEACGINVLRTTTACPVCRQPNFKIVRGHRLAVDVIQIMTSMIVYVCKHDNCLVEKNGLEIALHEATCAQKPVLCPKVGCLFWSPVDVYLGGQHDSCVTICEIEHDMWDFTVDANLIFNFDTNNVSLSSLLQPVVLKGMTESGIDSHAFINFREQNNYLLVSSGWLNTKEHMSQAIKDLKIEIFVYINTASGEVGQYAAKPPKFQGQELYQDDDGVCIPRHMLYNWAKWSTQYECPECPTEQRRIPHFHFHIVFL